MRHTLKMLGFAIVAAAAVGATGAQAQEPEFHCTSNTASCTVTGGSNDHVISLEGGMSNVSKTAA